MCIDCCGSDVMPLPRVQGANGRRGLVLKVFYCCFGLHAFSLYMCVYVCVCGFLICHARAGSSEGHGGIRGLIFQGIRYAAFY